MRAATEIFGQDVVKRLGAQDFASPGGAFAHPGGTTTHLRYTDCIAVLFYRAGHPTSTILSLWKTVARRIALPVMAICDLAAVEGQEPGITIYNNGVCMATIGTSPLGELALTELLLEQARNYAARNTSWSPYAQPFRA